MASWFSKLTDRAWRAAWSLDYKDQASRSSLPPETNLDLLLVGKTGHGKSSTGNTILGTQFYETSNKSETMTKGPLMSQTVINDRKLLVVDTPGIFDTDYYNQGLAFLKSEEDFTYAISLNPDGFHAIIIIYRFGERMTKAEKDAITDLKLLLGEDFITNHGVLVLTHGDLFEGESFENWCAEEKGYMKDLIRECQNRCLLFNNRGNEEVLQKQRISLVNMIDRIKGGRFTEGIFKTVRGKWTTVDCLVRKAYLDSCCIDIEIRTLLEGAKEISVDMIETLKLKLEQLTNVTRNVKGETKKKVNKQIERFTDTVTDLENKIKTNVGAPVTDRSSINDMIDASRAIRDALFKPISNKALLIRAECVLQ